MNTSVTNTTTAPDKTNDALCSSFGLGYSRFAPGTVGSAPAPVIYMLITWLTPAAYHTPLLVFMLLTSCYICVSRGGWAERYYGRKDPKQMVMDEWAGYFLVVLFFRLEGVLITAIWTFVMTRIFDILKPPPAGRLERIPRGWGILLDDLMASVYAVVALHGLRYLIPALFMRQ